MAHILYKYLDAIQHPTTGLLESFADSDDANLRGVTFTYDLALASLVFTDHHALEHSRKILGFFRAMPLPDAATSNYNTAYHIGYRLPTLEHAFQVGPLAWVALALMHDAKLSGQAGGLQKAIELLDWVRLCTPHFCGGVMMGTREPWSARMSVENNWAYYAALRMAIQQVKEGPIREAFWTEKEQVRSWLAHNERNRGEADSIKALDVYTNALLVGPTAHLEDVVRGDRTALVVWAKDWIEELEALFRVPGHAGYDYTDAKEAVRSDRARVSWLEGTEQVVVAYQTWAPFFEAQGDLSFAEELLYRASLAHAYVMRWSLLTGNAVAIPNTDAPEPVRTFADGWLARPSTEPALNGTTWTYFAEVGFNPLAAPWRNSR